MTRAEHAQCRQIGFLVRHKAATYEQLYKWDLSRLEAEYNTLKVIKTNERTTKARP